MHMLCSKCSSSSLSKSLKCIFVGYSRVQKGYKCYCLTLRRYFVSTDVTSCEQKKKRIPNFIIFTEKRSTSTLHIGLIYIYIHSWDQQYSKKIKENIVQYLTLPLKLEHICHMHQACYKCI